MSSQEPLRSEHVTSVGSNSIWLIDAAISAAGALLVSQAFLKQSMLSCNSGVKGDPADRYRRDAEVNGCLIKDRWTLLIDLVSKQSTIVRLESKDKKRNAAAVLSNFAIVAMFDQSD